MSHLRDYLEREGSVSAAQLDTAARRQQIYGGSLDTCLLELGYLGVEDLDRVMSNACGMPPAPDRLLASGATRPFDRVPADLVEPGHVFPLAVEDGQVLVAVHPDIPDDKLGALFRRVPGVRPVVAPECTIVRLVAEHEGSVVPQRYAVLCAKLDEPSRTTAGLGSTATPSGTPPPAAAQAPPPARSAVDATVPAEPPPPASPPSLETTLPPPPEPSPRQAVDPVALRAAVAPHRSVLEAARLRDATTDALTRCLMVIAQRVALFGVRRDGLMALSTPCEALQPSPDVAVPVREAGDVARALDGTQVLDRVADLDLRLAVGLEAAVPCVFEPVKVKDRPVLAAYLDRAGEPFHPAELEVARELCLVAGRTLEEVLRLRRTSGPTTSPASPQAEHPGLAQPRPEERTRSAQPEPRAERPTARPEAAAPPSQAQQQWRVPQPGPGGRGPEPTPPSPEAPRSWAPPPGSVPEAPAQEPAAAATTEPPAQEPATTTDAPERSAPIPRHAAGRTMPFLPEDVQDAAPARFAPPPAPTGDAGESPLPLTNPLPAEPPPVRTGRTEPGRPSPLGASAPSAEDRPAEPTGAASQDLQLPKLVEEPEAPELPRLVDTKSSHRGPTLYSELAPPPPSQQSSPSASPTIPAGLGPMAPGGDAKPEDFEEPTHPTIDASPPPPVLPPPPDAGTVTRSRRPKTLSGLPSESDAVETEPFAGEGIIALSTPIAERTSRGRIELDAEDRVAPDRPSADEAHIDGLIAELSQHGGDVEVLRSIGPPALIRITSRFPGPLEILRRDLSALPPPSAHGPLVRATIQLGGDIVPYLLELFEAPGPETRFYAAFVFQELRDLRCLVPQARLAFDPDGDVRVIAMRVLETYSRGGGFSEATAVVRAELDSPNRTRQLHAARAVGTLRDVHSVEMLIELLSSKDRFTQEAALESLCSITGQQHGLKPHRWRQWFIENGMRHRVEWIIDSLKHKELPVRRWAYDELVRITGHRIAFQPSGDRREREVAARAWLAWWTSEGRERLGVP